MSKLWDALRRAEKERAESPEDAEKVPQVCLTGCRKTLTFPAEHALGCPNTGKNELIIGPRLPELFLQVTREPEPNELLVHRMNQLEQKLDDFRDDFRVIAKSDSERYANLLRQFNLIERKLDVLLISPAKQKRKAHK